MDINNLNPRVSQKTVIILMTLSILVISFVTYLDIFTHFFAATDTITLIDTNRIQSPEKIIEIFTSPLMAGTSFTAGGLFYRPISSLTYSLDYFLWGLNPFGYHLTDLVLHMLVCVFVFYTLLLVTNSRKLVSWMSAIVFAIHPILVENVPAIARRQDTLAALFLLISLLLFFLSAQKRPGGLFFSLSLVSYCLALGSKETAIVLPALLFVHLFISSLATTGDSKPIGFYIITSLKKILPYIFIAFAYGAWRGYVLGGVGGYVGNNFGILQTVWFSIDTTGKFFSSLIFPAAPTLATQILMGFFVLCSLILLARLYFFNKETIMGLWFSSGMTSVGIFRRFCATVLLVSVIGVLSYPLYIHLLNRLVERTYNGMGLSILADFMGGRDFTPLSYYLSLVQNLVLFCLFALLISSLAGLLFAGTSRQSMMQLLSGSEVFRIMVFFAVWMLLPLSILLATRTFKFWNMYTPAIPFSALLSIALIEPIQHIKDSWAGKFKFSNLSYAAVWSSFTAACLVAYLFSFSPLLKKYDEWRDSGRLASTVLNELSRISAELPPGTTMHIYDLPKGIASYSTRIPQVKSVTYLEDYSIKSWLDLINPGNEIDVVVDRYSVIPFYPVDINFNVQLEENNVAVIIIELEQ